RPPDQRPRARPGGPRRREDRELLGPDRALEESGLAPAPPKDRRAEPAECGQQRERDRYAEDAQRDAERDGQRVERVVEVAAHSAGARGVVRTLAHERDVDRGEAGAVLEAREARAKGADLRGLEPDALAERLRLRIGGRLRKPRAPGLPQGARPGPLSG